MGTGKTHWGKIWAARHHFNFIDLDEAIEQQEQNTVADIFEKRGEDYFRQKEAIMLRSMNQYPNTIISCGGGVPCYFDNMSWINLHGNSVLLQATPAFILKNIVAQENKRPLVKNLDEPALMFYIEQKLKEREEFYNRANIIFNAELDLETSIDNFMLPIQ